MPASWLFRAVLFFAVCLVATAAAAKHPAGLETGQHPPDYLGRSTDGDKLYVADSAGQILVVTFWASWCAPCLKELPILNAIQKKACANRVRVVAINLKESRKQFRKVMRALEDYEINFVHDERGSVAKDYRVKGVPNLFIIDVDGRIAFRHVGYSDAALGRIVEDINSLLVKNQLH